MVKELLVVWFLFASPIIRNMVSSTGPGETSSTPTELSLHYQAINGKHRNAVSKGCYNGLFQFQKMYTSSWANDCSEACKAVVADVQERLQEGRSPYPRTQNSESKISVFKVLKNKCTASDSFKVILDESIKLPQEPSQCIFAPPPTTCMCKFTVDVESIFKATATSKARYDTGMQELPVSPTKCDLVTFGDWLHRWLPEAHSLERQQKNDPFCTAFKKAYPKRRIHNNELQMEISEGEWVPDPRRTRRQRVPKTSASGQSSSSRNPKRQRTVPDTCPAPTQAQMALNVDFGQFLSPIDENTCAAPPVRQSAIDIFFADNPQLVQLPPPSIAQDDGNEFSGDPLDELSKIFGSG